MKIALVKNGVFPITEGLKNEPIIPETGLTVAGTLQGEGLLAGVPSMFVRFAGCNLRCSWKSDNGTIDICDTSYASHFVREIEEWEPEDIFVVLQKNRGNIGHLVITGGEPTLQMDALKALLDLNDSLEKDRFHVTIETNGTRYDREIFGSIDLVSMSPKLASSNPTDAEAEANPDKTYSRHALRRFSAVETVVHMLKAGNNFQLKFVIASKVDEDEILTFLNKVETLALMPVPKGSIYVMPLGSNSVILSETSKMASEIAIRNNWRFSPRLQVDLFGNLAGV